MRECMEWIKMQKMTVAVVLVIKLGIVSLNNKLLCFHILVSLFHSLHQHFPFPLFGSNTRRRLHQLFQRGLAWLNTNTASFASWQRLHCHERTGETERCIVQRNGWEQWGKSEWRKVHGPVTVAATEQIKCFARHSSQQHAYKQYKSAAKSMNPAKHKTFVLRTRPPVVSLSLFARKRQTRKGKRMILTTNSWITNVHVWCMLLQPWSHKTACTFPHPRLTGGSTYIYMGTW